MPQEIEILLLPEKAYDPDEIRSELAKKIGCKINEISGVDLLKRSVDARRKPIKYLLRARVYVNEAYRPAQINIDYPVAHNKKTVHIVGAGPAGLFAALKFLECGFRPIVIERGKDVRNRRRDLAAINKEHIVNPESNYCFGEGGAGTYSDGKLYTRSTKRGDVNKILRVLVNFGATENILVDAHPHIGTNKLPQIITDIREKIIACGGEVRFGSRLTDIEVENGRISLIRINEGEKMAVNALVLATGHSARDIFYLLHNKNITLHAKPFAIGVRAEHPQQVIDQVQYKQPERGEYLPPASYSIVEQVDGKGVFSFCMCPGGIIAPCATNPEEIVTNGWSPSKRNNPYANSGIVVTVDENDFLAAGFSGPLAGLSYQQMVEKKCWEAGGKTQVAPAQRMVDFVNGKLSGSLPDCSYQPGITSVRLNEVLPATITRRLQKAFTAFGTRLKGYYTNDAVLVAPESRTSSPVRIPRDNHTLQHPEVQGLFPCGEGAGYAGGIVSAAIDGERCAEAAIQYLMANGNK